MSAESTNRWLILEQESDRPDWGKDCDGLVWNESGLIRQRPAAGQSPAEAEICVLFLPPVATGWTLPEQFDNRTQWRWNVWCHYGRDITVGQTASRWGTYERLLGACKARLSVEGSLPPLPFSRSMTTLPWTEEFLQLKEIAKSGGGGADGFRRSLDLLRRAWNLARNETDVQTRIRAGKEALPVILAAQWVLDAMPPAGKDNHTALTKTLNLCRESGLQAMAVEKEKFSLSVQTAFRSLQFTLMEAIRTLGEAQQKFKAAPQGEDIVVRAAFEITLEPILNSVRERIKNFIEQTRLAAVATTEELEHNPRHSRSTT